MRRYLNLRLFVFGGEGDSFGGNLKGPFEAVIRALHSHFPPDFTFFSCDIQRIVDFLFFPLSTDCVKTQCSRRRKFIWLKKIGKQT